MNDLESRLRDAGAHLRETAPTPEATDAALASLGDVALDDHDTHRSRRWLIGPAVIAAAAAVIGVVVVTRPDDAAIAPAGTTSVTESTSAPTRPPVTAPPTPAPTTVPPATAPPTSRPTTGTDLGFGVTLTTSDADFDGAGGACLTLSSATDRVSGCADGTTMRSAFGQPLALHLDGRPYTLFPRGASGAGEPELHEGAGTAGPCWVAADLAGALVETAACDGDGIGVLGLLPSTPGGAVSWTVTGAGDGVTLDQLAAAPDLGARVFRASRSANPDTCIVVVARNDSMREACGSAGANVYGAGSADAPLAVTADTAAGTASVEALDVGTLLPTNDCGDLTAGELLAVLPEHGMADALLCGPDVGAVHVASSLADERLGEASWDLLARGGDGTWSVSASEVDYTCTSGLAAEACTALDVFDLGQSPGFPSAASVAAFDLALGDGAPLPGRPAIEELPEVAPAPDVATLAESVVAAMRAGADPDQRVDVVSDSTPIVIRRTNLDDALTATIFVLRAGPVDSGYVVFANGTRAVDVCGRGTTDVDGETVCI